MNPARVALLARSPSQALARELKEEVGLTLNAPARLHGLFTNSRNEPNIRIGMFVVTDWMMDEKPRPQLEIIGREFFALDALPDDAAEAVHRRIAEVFHGRKISSPW